MRRFSRKRIALGMLMCSLFLLISCSSTTPSLKNRPITEINDHLQNGIQANQQVEQNSRPPADVSAALMPALNVKLPAADRDSGEQHFDISVNNVPAQSFFTGLVAGTKYNMVVSPKITGSISLDLKGVTIPEVMQAVHDSYGYEYSLTPYGYQVSSPGLQTKIFAVNYLDIKREGTSETQVSSGINSSINNGNNNTSSGFASSSSRGVSGTSGSNQSQGQQNSQNTESNTIVRTKTKSDFWKTLKETVEAIIGIKEGNSKGESVVVNAQAGLVVVRAYPAQLREVAKFLDATETSLNRQVIIEAKILDVQLKRAFQSGINWNVLGFKKVGDQQLLNVGLETFGIPDITQGGENPENEAGGLDLTFSGPGFDAAIKALDTQGNVQVLSSPRVSTVNNQKAIIKVGRDEFFVTNVSGNTLAAGTTAESTQTVDLTPFFSGIALDVTPEIDAKGDVTLHIHPTVSQVTDDKKTIQLGEGDDLVLPLALSNIRETDSIVHAKNGQVIVIGGLMTSNYLNKKENIPAFGRLPMIGPLFRDQGSLTDKTELVILLKPIVVNNESATQEMRHAAQTIDKMGDIIQKDNTTVPIQDWLNKPVS